MNDDFHNISIDFGKFVYIYLRKFLLVTKRVRGRFVAFSMSAVCGLLVAPVWATSLSVG